LHRLIDRQARYSGFELTVVVYWVQPKVQLDLSRPALE